MYLTHGGNLREETDESVIQTLLRKGWTVLEVPEYNAATQKIEFNGEFFDVIDKTVKEIDSEQIKLSIENGFLVQPEGFALALNDTDRIAFSQLLVLVKEALELGVITNDSPQIISDKDGQKHQVSTLRFRQIMVSYGLYYKTIWDSQT